MWNKRDSWISGGWKDRVGLKSMTSEGSDWLLVGYIDDSEREQIAPPQIPSLFIGNKKQSTDHTKPQDSHNTRQEEPQVSQIEER